MARAATSQELIYLRSEGQVSKLGLAVYTPGTVLTARVGTPPSSYDNVKVVNIGSLVGSYSDVQDGMTVLIGSVAGGSDIGIVRAISATATVLNIGSTSEIPWTAGQYITVISDWLIWARKLDFADGVWNIEGDVAYTDQNLVPDPIPVLGPIIAVKVLTGSTVSHTMSASGTWVPAGSIASYSWSAPGASATSGLTTQTPTLTYNSVGSYRVDCTVTTAAGKTSSGHRYIQVVDNAGGGSITQFGVTPPSGSLDQGGWSFDVTLYAGADLSQIRDRALIVLYARDFYGGTEISIGPIPGYENVICCGWIEGETIHENPELGTVEFRVSGPASWLQKVSSWPISLLDTDSNPTDWMHISGLTIDRGIWHLMHWRSTTDRICDVIPTGDTRRVYDCSANGSVLWDQLKAFSDVKIGATPGVDRYGRLIIQIDPNLLPVASRGSIPVVQTITKKDWLGSIDIQVKLPTTALLETAGFAYVGGQWTALLSRAPGNSMARFGSGLSSRYNLVFSDQTAGNALTAAIFAKGNNIYASVPIDLAENNRLIDIVPQQYLQISLDPADTPRGITWTNQRIIPRQVEYSFENGMFRTSIECEVETVPGTSVSVIVPEASPTTITGPVTPNFPSFPISPGIPGIPGNPPVINYNCFSDLEARSNGPFTISFSPSSIQKGQTSTSYFPCSLRPVGSWYPTRLQVNAQLIFNNSSIGGGVNCSVDAMNGASVVVSGTYVGNGWQFSTASPVNVTGFRITFNSYGGGPFYQRIGTPITSGGISATSDIPVAISGLTAGHIYCLETTSYYSMRINPNPLPADSSGAILVINGSNTPPFGYFDVGTPASGWTLPAGGAILKTEQIGATNSVRCYFTAGSTNAFITGDGFRTDNGGNLSYVIYQASEPYLAISPSSLYNVCDAT